jgi:hypothetical protein
MSRLGNWLKSDRYASISYALFIDSMKIISSTLRGVAGRQKIWFSEAFMRQRVKTD